ncbi:MAG: helix-turn-helix transcriptional regulator [Clostridia bacterium]|nr:helix-turn-helix transcriptional regulator [Clostridia bacterium]
MSIGSNIAKFRKEKGLTQNELGERLGVTNQAISKWETETSMPDVMLLPEIAKALGVSLEMLYSDEEDTKITVAQDLKDKRIVKISVDEDDAKVVVRLPISALDLIKDESGIGGFDKLLKMLNGVNEGTLVDVDDDGTKVKITVEEYDFKNN